MYLISGKPLFLVPNSTLWMYLYGVTVLHHLAVIHVCSGCKGTGFLRDKNYNRVFHVYELSRVLFLEAEVYSDRYVMLADW